MYIVGSDVLAAHVNEEPPALRFASILSDLFFPRLMLLIRAQYPLRRDVTSTTSLYRTRFQSTTALRKHGACVYPRAGFDRRGFRFALCFRADPISR